MPLKDRDKVRPRRLIRLGIIRLGHKEKKEKKRQDGTKYTVEYPVQDDHFVLTDAPQIAEFYEAQDIPLEEVRELQIVLPFPDIERNYDAWYQLWAGGVLVCKGDGEYVQYATNFEVKEKSNGKVAVHRGSAETLVADGAAQADFAWNGEAFTPGELVPCSGAGEPLYPHCRACRLSGLLKVMMAHKELARLGYYQIATGSGRNYDTINGTLEWVRDAIGKVSGIRYYLRLVEEPITYVEDNERKQTRKWFLQLEPFAEDLARMMQQQRQRALGIRTAGLLASPDTEPEAEWEEVEEEAAPPFAEEGGPAEEPEEEAAVTTATEELGGVKVKGISSFEEFSAAVEALAIDGKQVNAVFGMGVKAWREKHKKTWQDCLDELRAVCGR